MLPKNFLRLFSITLLYSILIPYGIGQKSVLKVQVYESASSITNILDTIVTRSSYEQTVQFSDSLYKGYLENGFFSSYRSSVINTNKDTLLQQFYLGKQYKTIFLEQHNNIVDEIVGSKLSRKRNHYKSLDQLKTHLNQLQESLNKDGYPFAKVTLDRLDLTSKKDTAIAVLKIEENSSRTIDRIIVKGYPQIPRGLTKRMLGKDLIYNPRNIDKILNTVQNTRYLKSTRETEALFKKDSTLLYLYVERVKSNIADGLLAFNNNDGTLQLTGYLQANMLNNFNLGESIAFEYRSADGDQSSLDITTAVPYTLFNLIGIEGRLNITRRDSTYQNSTVSIGASYPITSRLKTSISYLNTNSNATTSIASENRNEDFDVSGISLQMAYKEYGDNALQPEKLSGRIMTALQTRYSELATDDQIAISGQITKLSRLNSRFFLHNAVQGSYLITSNLQFNELTQIGGQRTIRGFNVNSIDTSQFLSFQNELRYLINKQIYLHSIADVGSFEEFRTGNSQYLYSFGAGLAILTKAGLLRLTVANGNFIDANDAVSSTIADINLSVNF